MLLAVQNQAETGQRVNKKKVLWSAFAVLALVMGVIQFVPSPPVVVPAQLPDAERAAHRLLNFEGIHNFRDLGGYSTADGRTVKWGALYRSGTLAEASRSDLAALESLQLNSLIDFRSAIEKEEEPNKLPEAVPFAVVEIPTLDDGNKALVGEVMERIESGNFEGFDANASMLEANRQFADEFTPQFRQFINTVMGARGEPVLWHCSAGKDRTGFAAAIVLRILGVPYDVIMQDYMASLEPALASRQSQLTLLRLFKGQEAAGHVAVMMGVEPDWLDAAFAEIDQRWGDFDTYVSEGLELSSEDIEQLRNTLLE
tara:strand:+ start:156101 stop:157042 length:942 start_codon:yes stop_codon:yes gene_type:complete